MKIAIINGPNLNLLGKREPEVYGKISFEQYFETLKTAFPNVELTYFQSNVEGVLIDKLQELGFSYDGIIFNGGAYTHYSYAIRDAIAAIKTPVVEVHISNVYAREEFRHKSISGGNAVGVITGLGMKGYDLAVRFFLER
ncbi:type II 3-dehydroquinate dehydratase [Chitinophaga pollutisoli]|uniref:3-dehydroquinate dehydratase n=1 Tax=Chitinophaga pollutisoli TaxID=3133966 RepID=A0ABZ2YUU9_9BACT